MTVNQEKEQFRKLEKFAESNGKIIFPNRVQIGTTSPEN